MRLEERAEIFYKELIEVLVSKKIPFFIGGTYAFSAYTDIQRPTKDMDIFSTTKDLPRLLKACSEEGYGTELFDESWIAKVYKGTTYADIIFAEKNGLHRVDEKWLERAREGTVLGLSVKLMPIEEMIRSKAYIQTRNRYDGPDVIHLILRQGKNIDWRLLMRLMGENWEVIFAHIINFNFVYPSEKDIIPSWVYKELFSKFEEFIKKSPEKDKITRGLLFSSLYKVAIEKWGFQAISYLPNGTYEK